jgi:hypothetical protein
VKAGVRAVSSNAVAEQAKPETVSATLVKAWVSIEPWLLRERIITDIVIRQRLVIAAQGPIAKP